MPPGPPWRPPPPIPSLATSTRSSTPPSTAWWRSPARRILVFNAAAQRTFGYTPRGGGPRDGRAHRPAGAAAPPPRRRGPPSRRRTPRRAGPPHRDRGDAPRRQRLPGRAHRDPRSGEPALFVGWIRDITDRRAADAELKASRLRIVRRRTPRAGGSSATCTTARSSGSSSSRSSCAASTAGRPGRPRARRRARGGARRARRRDDRPARACPRHPPRRADRGRPAPRAQASPGEVERAVRGMVHTGIDHGRDDGRAVVGVEPRVELHQAGGRDLPGDWNMRKLLLTAEHFAFAVVASTSTASPRTMVLTSVLVLTEVSHRVPVRRRRSRTPSRCAPRGSRAAAGVARASGPRSYRRPPSSRGCSQARRGRVGDDLRAVAALRVQDQPVALGGALHRQRVRPAGALSGDLQVRQLHAAVGADDRGGQVRRPTSAGGFAATSPRTSMAFAIVIVELIAYVPGSTRTTSPSTAALTALSSVHGVNAVQVVSLPEALSSAHHSAAESRTHHGRKNSDRRGDKNEQVAQHRGTHRADPPVSESSADACSARRSPISGSADRARHTAARCSTSPCRRRGGPARRRRRSSSISRTSRAAAAASAKTPSASRPRGPSRSSTISRTVIWRRVLGERVAALDASLGLQDPAAAQRGEELLEELDRDVAAAGELSDRDRAVAAAAAELGEGLDGVGRLGRDREHGGRHSREPGAPERKEPATRAGSPGTSNALGRRAAYSQPRSVARRTAWARSTAPSLP